MSNPEKAKRGRPIGFSPINGEGGAMVKKSKTWSMPTKNWEWLESQSNQGESLRCAIDLCRQIQEESQMSIEQRRQNIIETAQKYNTLIELPPHYIEQVARGGANPKGYSEHQKSAARIASKTGCPFESRIILEWCAADRPDLFMGMVQRSKIRQYELWQEQHSKSVQDLAWDWADECEAAQDSIKRVYEYVEVDAL